MALYSGRKTEQEAKTNQQRGHFTLLWLANFAALRKRFDDSNEDEDIENTDYVPDDAINQMHRYRDALIRLSEPHLPESPSSTITGQSVNKSRLVLGAFALLPSQEDDNYCGRHWLLSFLKTQIGIAASEHTANSNTKKYPVLRMQEKLYVQDASRIPYYGMQQNLYPSLTMTVALGGKNGRNDEYFEAFDKGIAQFYHLPQSTFSPKFKQHIAQEIRYLALATTSDIQSNTKKIDKLWPVKRVSLLPRFAISEAQAGRQSDSNALYYLFELGKPLLLQESVTHVPHRPIKNTMKLTTLDLIQKAQTFSQIESVYVDALVETV